MERITSALNPWDFFLWISEEIETRDLGSKSLGTQLGLALNFIFLLARANGAYSTGSADDVFSDYDGVSWVAYFVSHAKILCSLSRLFDMLTCFVLSRPGPSPGH